MTAKQRCSSAQLHVVGTAVLLVGPLTLAPLLLGSTTRLVHIRRPSSSFHLLVVPQSSFSSEKLGAIPTTPHLTKPNKFLQNKQMRTKLVVARRQDRHQNF